ncbi:MAG: extensin family protein [Bradyrhizobiaceae bacterium]|nr:extensin family protein [Bradyrhizobiaceae bacterium]
MPLPRPAALDMKAPLPVARPGADRASVPTPKAAVADAEQAHCTALIAANIATFEHTASVSGISGEALCGDEAPVRMTAVKLADGGSVELRPVVVARCEIALQFARWVRDDLAPATTPHDGALQRLEIAASYSCRPRNHLAGARLSEHGLANAIDVRAVVLSRGGRVAINDLVRPAMLFGEMRRSACARFTTVLGPGADAAHADHLHVDLARRRNGYRICQWDPANEPMP